MPILALLDHWKAQSFTGALAVAVVEMIARSGVITMCD
ncbi:MAG: hypothetical protein AVDCRST_MAG42-491 [uncultured Chthoniobacterales bacterium]|uniref:Uncharacterized protein n=1 Tax=uncultured Chthoniobacterales bacterium TaxID=1836801 RepID=A0A6J4HEW5_9BACT|nr:MAG: hypothetical protein AVDCRST_MAG42-491 [uncultured Chthoniobacterales bacterium]